MLPTRNQARTLGLACATLLVLGSIWAGVLPLWAQPALPELPAPGVVITEDSRLNMRSGPGIDYSLVIKLDPQTEVTVVATNDDATWYEIEVPGVGSGWVAAEWIRLAGAESNQAGLILVPTPTPARETPEPAEVPSSERLGIAALIAPSATVTSPIALEDADADAAAPSESVATVGESTTTTSITDTSSLTTTSIPVTAVAESGVPTVGVDSVTTPAATAEAPAEESEDATAAAEDAATTEPTSTPVPTADVPTAIIQPTRMNVRGGPGTNYPVVATVNGQTALVILGMNPNRDWYRVEYEGVGNDEQAWVFASLTTVIGPADQIEIIPEEELPPAPTSEAQAAQVQPVSAPVVAAPPPSGAGFFGYGVQAHMLGGGVGEAMNATGDLGFNWMKQQVEWRLFQPSPGAIGFGELGGIVSAAGQRNINLLFSVVNAPEWARESGFDGSVGGPPADPGTYAAFVGAMAGEFCGTALKAIEIWNEQNLHYEWGNKPLDPAEYMNLLRAAYGSIKAACPEMLVISGALTPAGSNPPFAMDDFAYLEGMYQNGLAAVSDGIGAHPSGYNVPASVGWEQACAVIQDTGNMFNGACDTPHHSWSFRSTMEGYRNIMVVYGDANKRIWPTEFGWAAGGAFDPRYAYANDNSFDEQAAWTVEAYTMMRNWGWVGPAFLWNLNFRVVADGTEKAQWGIVRNDYTPLPVYSALKAMPK